ncbi:exonuclease 1 isoform X2 [Anopheles moucheti]|uniref:exonuclease 1 isoform X2 n=1 Tax=Anopheles moucheti TaxID=186751 RepID=UPI0022F01C4E|nr:exonuclease 1 isoform X2 [Anopheles moucheti]
MGITGLLPFLEKASSACHLRDLRGKCVAIDTYCWLHRGAFACAERLARGESTDTHILYCLKYVQLLLSYNIKPILVFDGQHLPAKAATEAKRRESRTNARKRGAELLRQGRIEEARSFLRRCVDITHEMALQLIRECHKRGVDCIVAPYEADAQLAYLNRTDIAQYVITEDSDLVLFGCSRILFKLDLTGNGRLVEASKLHLAMGCREDRYKFEKFRYMCILSGCDYLDSLPGIGLAKACKFMLKTEDPDVRRALAKIPAYLNMRQLSVTEEYKDEFMKADATFRHMVVYDPVHRRQTRLTDPDEEETPEQYCCNSGKFLDENTAFELAVGNLDPFSLRKMDDWHPDTVQKGELSAMARKMLNLSIWRKDFNAQKEAKAEMQPQNRISSLSVFVKRSLHPADEADQECKETIADVLQAYGIQNGEPVSKRLCQVQSAVFTTASKVSIEYKDLEALDVLGQLDQPATPKRKRNPFAISPSRQATGRDDSVDDLLSPTKITAANRSLLHNISPVKRIDYSQQHSQFTVKEPSNGVAAVSRLGRLNSTHSKGVSGLADEPKVISRFFASQAKVQMHRTNCDTVIGEPISSPSKNGGRSGGSILVSPTAIVKDIKSKRDAQALKATALYLSSPEAQLQCRGDRTPVKRRPNATSPETDPAKGEILGQLDSGMVSRVDTKGQDDEAASLDEDISAGLSSSQKENDDVEIIAPEKQCSNPKPRTARLALFERRVTKTLNQAQNPSENVDEELAIVLDDDSNDGDNAGKLQTNDRQETEERNASLLALTAKVETSTKIKARSSCKRPGLSTTRKSTNSKTDNSAGLTQTRLSMFGFQKKPSMQLNNR